MLSTSLVLMSGVNSVMASTGADFGTIHTSTHHLGWSRQISCGLNCATKRVGGEPPRAQVGCGLDGALKRVASNTVPASEFSRLSVTHLASPDTHLSPEFQNQLSTVILGLDRSIQVAKDSMFNLDASVKHWHDGAELKLAADIMLEHRASGQYPLAASFPRPPVVASVCFITDTNDCSGISGAGSENGGNFVPPDFNVDNYERCAKEGYTQTACTALQVPDNLCPYNNGVFEKCICRSDLKSCEVPEYGVGESCDGKYASCQRDDEKACFDEGYTQTEKCSSVQTAIDVCPYNSAYHKGCRCKTDLKSCSVPEYGVGESCDGKYAACKEDAVRACNEEGYNDNVPCSSVQTANRECPYDKNYHDKCICKTGLTSCTGLEFGVGESCNGKYTSCSFRPDNIICGNYTLPPNANYSKIVSTCSELQNAISSGVSGNIVINGVLNCGSASLAPKAGQNLVGLGYFYNTEVAGYNNEMNSCSTITFSNPSADYAMAPKSLEISHVNLKLTNSTGSDKYLLFPLDNNVALKNVDLSINGKRSLAIVGSTYGGKGRGENIEIKNIVNIYGTEKEYEFAANVVNLYIRDTSVLNIDKVYEAISSASVQAYDNSQVNVRLGNAGHYAFFNGRPNFNDSSELNVYTSGTAKVFYACYPGLKSSGSFNIHRGSGCLVCNSSDANPSSYASFGAGTVFSLPEGTYKVNSSCTSGNTNLPCSATKISTEKATDKAAFNKIFSSGIFAR